MTIAPIRMIWFDLDGTLLGSNPIRLHFSFIARAVRSLRNEGFSVLDGLRALHACRRAIETGNPQTGTNIDRARVALAHALNVNPEKAALLLRSVCQFAFSGLQESFFALPRGRALVDQWATRLPCILATNPIWPLEIVLSRLQWAEIKPESFVYITNAENMNACKPRLEYFRQLTTISARDPVEILLIGDSERKDLPAADTGVRVFLLSQHERLQALSTKGAQAWTGNHKVLEKFLNDHAQTQVNSWHNKLLSSH